MLREANHRVANSLAIVAALTNMQRSHVAEPSAQRALDEMQVHPGHRRRAQAALYVSDVETVDIQAYLVGLAEELSAAMLAWGTHHTIRLEAEAITLPTDKAVSLGIIVTELVTNAYKYAYAGNTSGDILVRIVREPDHAALSVEDYGVGMPRD